MNPSSVDPLRGANAANAINANRAATQNTKSDTVGDGGKESRAQKLNRIKEQIANGTFTPDLQSLAKKLVQGGYLKD